MTLFDLILIAVSLSMDAFAVSICKGLSVRKVSLQHAMICGVWFGGFQFLMPALGYFLGDRFAALLTKFGPWIAFVLLALIGANMIKESFGGDEQLDDDYSAKAMLPLAIATSIDAFAVGVSFAAMQVDILPAAGLIGIITCLLSAVGVKVGAMFGEAVVFTHGNMPKHFVTIVKQHGALLAKGWLLGLQFDTLFTDGLYLRIARHANDASDRIRKVLVERGYTLTFDAPTNQIFVTLDNEISERLQRDVRLGFTEKADDTHTVMRICTSWATREEDVDALIKDIRREK